jgi:hypothetical protein
MTGMNSVSAALLKDALDPRDAPALVSSDIASTESWPVAVRGVPVDSVTLPGASQRIDAMIASKRQLSDDLLDGGGSGELNLTELADEELLRLVRLDLHTASAET